MRRRLSAALGAAICAAVLACAGASPASATVLSQNGTGVNGDGTLQNVGMDCTFNTGAVTLCTKTWTALGGVHSIGWAGEQYDETVLNSTGVPWSDYHFAFAGMDYAVFGPQTFLPAGTVVQSGADTLDLFFSGGPLLPGQSFTIEFLFSNVTPGAGIEQFPTVPEPASLALLGTGLLALAATRRRRAA